MVLTVDQQLVPGRRARSRANAIVIVFVNRIAGIITAPALRLDHYGSRLALAVHH